MTRMVILPLRLVGVDLDAAGDLGHDGRVLRLAGLEDLGDARETADDVLRARGGAGLAGEHLAGLDHLAVLGLDAGLGREEVEVENGAALVLDDDLRVLLALVLDDDQRFLPWPASSSRTVSPTSMST